jgi:hypothetical protein
MKILDNLGVLFFSVLLIVWSTLSLFELQIPNLDFLIAILALLSSVLLLFRLRDSKAYVNVGMLILCIWLFIVGILPILGTDFPNSTLALAIIAVVAGLFFLPVIFAERTFYNLGLFLLGLWLILSNSYHIWGFQFPAINVALALLGTLAALLLIIGL